MRQTPIQCSPSSPPSLLLTSSEVYVNRLPPEPNYRQRPSRAQSTNPKRHGAVMPQAPMHRAQKAHPGWFLFLTMGEAEGTALHTYLLLLESSPDAAVRCLLIINCERKPVPGLLIRDAFEGHELNRSHISSLWLLHVSLYTCQCVEMRFPRAFSVSFEVGMASNDGKQCCLKESFCTFMCVIVLFSTTSHAVVRTSPQA